MRAAVAILLTGLTFVLPNRVACPDGQTAAFTGKTRPASTGIECQYSYVHVTFDGDIMREEKPVLWAPCRVMVIAD